MHSAPSLSANRVYVGQELGETLANLLSRGSHHYLLADASVWEACGEIVEQYYPALQTMPRYLIDDAEAAKSLEGIAEMTHWLLEEGATRSATLVALGGGATTDAVAFLAHIYMRGVECILLPTTLLSMVDASIGGKCGVNFAGTKNLLGAFADELATTTLCDTLWLRSLPEDQLWSGCAELLKTALLRGDDLWHDLLREISSADPWTSIASMIREAVRFKLDVVAQDRTDQGVRHQLNLGHTFGHAFEAWSYTPACPSQPLLHGEAVALGLVVELYVSCVRCDFPREPFYQLISIVKEHYRSLPLNCRDYPALITLMQRDKKNASADEITCVALRRLGEPETLRLTTDEVREALDFYQDTIL